MNGVTQVSAHTFEIGGMGAAPPVSVEIGAPVVQSVTAPPLAVPSTAEVVIVTPAVPTLRQQLAQMKSRLREVTRQLRDKRALERERDQLQRLIKAATQETDNVRRLRSAG
jgi:hypothetical protein